MGFTLQYLFLAILLLLLTACNGPSPFTNDPASIRQTVGAFVSSIEAPAEVVGTIQSTTEGNQGNTLIPEILLTSIPGAIKPVNTESGIPGSTPSQPANPNNCNLAAAGNPIDVTIPDGTVFAPGQYFTKTWRLVNSGSCSWTPDYVISWFSGEKFNTNAMQSLGVTAEPGETIEVSIDMMAPVIPGQYQGYWKLMSPDGRLFGIGPNGDAPFWVKIIVVKVETETPQPTATAVPAPKIAISGEVSMAPGDILDLDSGTLNPEAGDIALELTAEGELRLVAQNQTGLVYFGPNIPLEWECRSGGFGSTSLDLKTIKDGSQVCFRSSQGSPGYITIDPRRYSDKIIDIKFVTWFVP